MFYETSENRHGLPHDPFKALVVPRPIGWISTRSGDGQHVNLAPYSFFNIVCDVPKLVMFSSAGAKDSVTFARESGEFVVNLAGEALADRLNATSVDAPRGVSEFGYAGLTEAPCNLVRAPRVLEAYAALECKVTQVLVPETLDGQKAQAILTLGQVVGIHIDDAILSEGRVDVTKSRPLARLGYLDFAAVHHTFALKRPKWDG
jgi:flavin reductase (DIM6/NTAB) family NADH-FMN oxidoreductase RutF